MLKAGDNARGGFWRWALSLLVLCIAFCIIAFAFIQGIPLLLGEQVALIVVDDAFRFKRSEFLISTILMFAFIAALIPAIALSLRVLKLRLTDLIAPFGRVRWKLIATTALATFLFMLFGTIISFWAVIPSEDFYFFLLPPGMWHFVPLIIGVIILQAAAEELLLRGYLLQMIGRLTRSWWLILIAIGSLFFALHLANPEVEIFGWYAYLSYALSSLLFTLLALATGRLEYSIGVHIGWNWSVMIVDIDLLKAPDLYTGFGAVVYTGPLAATWTDAVTQILLHIVIGLWCLTAYFNDQNRQRI